MANWYVRKGGSDSNGGSSASLTPDRSGSDMSTTSGSAQVTSASAVFSGADVGKGINIAGTLYRIATFTNSTTIQLDRVYASTTGVNRAWAIGGALLTINKITSPTITTAVQAGDTIYVGPGIYRELITCGASFSGSQVTLFGDVSGSHTGDAPGEVRITAYLTNETTAPSALNPLLTINNKNFWAYRNITWYAGGANPKYFSLGTSTNITFTNCAFHHTHSTNVNNMTIGPAANVASNILFDSCWFEWLSNSMQITLPTSASADYDVNIVFKNCICPIGGVTILSSGALSFKGGGVYFYNCYLNFVTVTGTTTSTTFPVKVENCIIVGALNSGLLGEIVEDYNNIFAAVPRFNTAIGAHSISDASRSAFHHFGQEHIWGGAFRPCRSPIIGSGSLGFGASANAPVVDALGAPRPAGGGSASYAVGPFERGNTFVKETGTVRTGTNSISITGPGYQEFLIPVDATSTTITVYVRWDATYSGTKPAMTVDANAEIGVTAATTTAVGSSGAWEQLSLNFTPTAKGIVTLRLLSSDTNGAGHMYVDDFAVA